MLSNSCFVSAVITIVITTKNILWSLVVKSSKNSFDSALCCSMSYGIIALKLLFAFCFLCQFVILVSIPILLFSASFTASSCGTGIISIESIIFLLSSVSSVTIESFTKLAYSFKNITFPYLSPILK